MSIRVLLGGTALAVVLAVPAGAQDATTTTGEDAQAAQTQSTASPPVIALNDWTYDDLYANGWSLEKLIEEARVFGVEGEEIGDIENVMIGEDGKILAIVAEVGGFLDIGDTHVSVPWERVEFSPALDYIKVPVNQDNVEEYSVFGDWGFITKIDTQTKQVINEDVVTGPRVWKATELLDDHALLSGSMAFGYVDDLIFTNDGMLHAVVVNPDLAYAGGPRAFPYYGYGYGWSPASTYYALPYNADEVAVINTFDYDQMHDDVTMTGTAPATEPATTGSVQPETEVGGTAEGNAESTAN